MRGRPFAEALPDCYFDRLWWRFWLRPPSESPPMDLRFRANLDFKIDVFGVRNRMGRMLTETLKLGERTTLFDIF